MFELAFLKHVLKMFQLLLIKYIFIITSRASKRSRGPPVGHPPLDHVTHPVMFPEVDNQSRSEAAGGVQTSSGVGDLCHRFDRQVT